MTLLCILRNYVSKFIVYLVLVYIPVFFGWNAWVEKWKKITPTGSQSKQHISAWRSNNLDEIDYLNAHAFFVNLVLTMHNNANLPLCPSYTVVQKMCIKMHGVDVINTYQWQMPAGQISVQFWLLSNPLYISWCRSYKWGSLFWA